MLDFRFHHFELPLEGIDLPERFTYPFNYIPTELSKVAAGEVMSYIEQNLADQAEDGKMFGVLVVLNKEGQLGFLAAYSGLLAARNDHPYFVPAVYDMMQPDGYFKVHESEISEINDRVRELETSLEYQVLCKHLSSIRLETEAEIAEYKAMMAESKKQRDIMRKCGADDGQLLRESQFQKAELRRLKKYFQERIDSMSEKLDEYQSVISELKIRRQALSDALQKWLFEQFRMLNARGEERDLNEIFAWYSTNYAGGNALKSIPPAGSGECCAPKLLQYAYIHHYKPVCMAEFWWGASPKGEIREHGHYYPSCQGKCKPILTFMLQGLEVDDDPLSDKKSCRELEIIYEDDDIVIVNKPAGMLSVPGKNEHAESVYSVLQRSLSEVFMVHRLDMDTSGLMVVAKNKAAHESLQRQFAGHGVSKTYVALVGNGGLKVGQTGRIELPLSADYLDRPRQKVDFESGKTAITDYKVLEVNDFFARVELCPRTGRTHQLRMHCAHAQGLASPILGDPLYGNPSERMYLHASVLTFEHPSNGEKLIFKQKADF